MRKQRPDLAARMDQELAEAVPPAPVKQDQSPVSVSESREASYVPPSRQNMKRIQGYFSARVKRQFRTLAAEHDKTEDQLVTEALNLLFQHYGCPLIAFDGKGERS